MTNQTFPKDFNILAFSSQAVKQPVIFLLFLFVYIAGILGNGAIIILVYIDAHLHTPMYFFLSNLSFIDICFTTVIFPKLMDILLSGNGSISFIECFSQIFFSVFIGITETLLLSFMAYDRYIAVCNPLHYHLIMNNEKCLWFLLVTWFSGFGNSLFFTGFATQLSICHPSNIEHFFCELKALVKITCTNLIFQAVIMVETLLFGVFPFLFSLISYVKIISSILCMKSRNSRKKAFSTCTSHLAVLSLYYGTILSEYWRSPSEKLYGIDQVISLLYTALIPMLNPLIYSLRNKEVKSAMLKLVTKQQIHK